MRGVSTKTLTAVLESVDRQVDERADAYALGAELFEVVALLDVQPGLRRVLTDPSAEPAAREQLARRLLEGRVGAATLDVVSAAAGGRWSAMRDLPDALEQAGVAAHIAGADRDGHLDEVQDELFRFGRVVASEPELRSALTDRRTSRERKQDLVARLLGDKASTATVALVREAVAGRARGFEATIAQFGELAASRRDRLVATVRVAAPLAEEQRTRLAAALGRTYGRDVHVNTIVDPAALGGVSVEIGEDVLDGSIASRLEDARRRIAG